MLEELCCLRPVSGVPEPPPRDLEPGSSGGRPPSTVKVPDRAPFREEALLEEKEEEVEESEFFLLSTLRDLLWSSRLILLRGPKRPLFCWVLLKRSISLPTEEMVSVSREFGDLAGTPLPGEAGSPE